MKGLGVAFTLMVVLAGTGAVAASDAQQSFDKLKTLAGSWEGTGPDGKPMMVSYRMSSHGSALFSEIHSEDDMVTVFHLDGNRLLMTHYCGAGNQPRMVATVSPD